MTSIVDPDCSPLPAWLAAERQPRFRMEQILHWIFHQRCNDWSEMSDLPQALRTALAQAFPMWSSHIARQQLADDGTVKLLLQLEAGGQTECVLLPGPRHRSVCISTQVGCAMGCRFCASGLEGVERNLSAGEILEQVLWLQQQLDSADRISHMVIMGMGEPLANLDALLVALDEVHRPERLGIGARRITISTVGLPDGIHRLAEHSHPYHLAISLHAPTDDLRNELIPVNRRIGLGPILSAADHYFEVTGRRVTYEYVLLAGVNDRETHAHQLVELLRGRNALVNLIPFNAVPSLPFATPSAADTGQFRRLLENGGLQVQVRQRKGDRIAAACGQLRHRRAEPPDQVKTS